MPFDCRDYRQITQRFACLYKRAPGVRPATKHLSQARDEINFWFDRIPIKPLWHPNAEPYTTFEQMVADIERGTFRVKDYQGTGYVSPVWGDIYNRMRAVHDWYGHYAAGNGFGTIGELSAYGVHVGMFSAEIMPLIFNEIVLANATREMFGDADDKLVVFHV